MCECKDGAEAVGTFARFQPAWVLMDVSMKDTDGIAATRLLTAAFPGAQVVMVMDSLDVQLRKAVLNAGACAFVAKENLLEIRSLLESPPGAVSFESSSPSQLSS